MYVADRFVDARRTSLKSGERVVHDLFGHRAAEGDRGRQIEQLPAVLAVQHVDLGGPSAATSNQARPKKWIAQHAHRVLAIRLHIMT